MQYENQRLTVVANVRTSPYDVYIGRGSKWGNPFKMQGTSLIERDRVCDLYEAWFWTTNLIDSIDELKGKVLGCYCKPLRCHGDFLAAVANGEKRCP
jgi:hypothetical protein